MDHNMGILLAIMVIVASIFIFRSTNGESRIFGISKTVHRVAWVMALTFLFAVVLAGTYFDILDEKLSQKQESILAGLFVGLVLFLVGSFLRNTYNQLVLARNAMENKWHDIAVQLKRRDALIPRLFEIAQIFLKHEKDTLEGVTHARNQAASTGERQERMRAEEQLTVALNNLFAIVENYPTLKSNENVMALHNELTQTENVISQYRHEYNRVVKQYNDSSNIFPINLIARLFNFTRGQYV